MMLPRTLLAICVLASVTTIVAAHHSGAMFDRGKTATITGTVTEFNWTNPHSSIKVEVTAGGKAESWAIEMNSPNNLVREGWKRTTLKPGDKVTLTINPLRDGKPGGWYLSIKLPDGKQLGTTTGPPGS
jgi:uncharacterized cupredoxin-like copper-binding protein